LLVDRSERQVVPLADIDESLVGQTILVQGVLTSVRAPRPGSKAPWGLVLSEGDDQIRVTFWDSLYEALQDKTRLTPGQSVRLYAAVTTYKGDVQLKLNQARDLEYLSEELPAGAIAGAGVPREAEVLMLEEISAEHKGQTVETEGQVVKVFEPKKDSKAPYKVILEDGNGKVAVVYWDKVAKELNGRKPVEGARMQVRGKVDQYKDEIQVKVQYADQMTLLALPDKARPERPKDTTPVADITMAMTGTPVVISGRLSEPKSLPGGVIYTLKDDSGKMPLVLWDRFIPGEEREDLQGGKIITVRGEVGTYKGALQVVPRDPAELWIHTKGGAN
jgi:DNA/RNA endonuclease YhcR with UshA esterase domain